MAKELKHKPLAEAILELKWNWQLGAGKLSSDPYYRILLGRLSERVSNLYPVHEPLPTASAPDEMVSHFAQHRFRAQAGGWPLVQLGPGVFTLNETSGYTWQDFKERCEGAIKIFMDSHPNREAFKPQSLALWYIDTIEHDYTKNNIFDFLKEKMKTRLELPQSLFTNPHVKADPVAFKWQVSYRLTKPHGEIKLRFGTGTANDKPALVWETLVISKGDEIPNLQESFPEWLNGAHDLTDDWFFKLIDGELLRRFSGE